MGEQEGRAAHLGAAQAEATGHLVGVRVRGRGRGRGRDRVRVSGHRVLEVGGGAEVGEAVDVLHLRLGSGLELELGLGLELELGFGLELELGLDDGAARPRGAG